MTATGYRTYTGDYEYQKELRRRKMRAGRKKEVRKHIFLIILGVILVIGLSVSYHAIRSNANTDIQDVQYKYYTSISIAYGETLWSLAEKYAGSHYSSTDDYIKEVMGINHLQTDEITAGQYLVIPYYSQEFIGETAGR